MHADCHTGLIGPGSFAFNDFKLLTLKSASLLQPSAQILYKYAPVHHAKQLLYGHSGHNIVLRVPGMPVPLRARGLCIWRLSCGPLQTGAHQPPETGQLRKIATQHRERQPGAEEGRQTGRSPVLCCECCVSAACPHVLPPFASIPFEVFRDKITAKACFPRGQAGGGETGLVPRLLHEERSQTPLSAIATSKLSRGQLFTSCHRGSDWCGAACCCLSTSP